MLKLRFAGLAACLGIAGALAAGCGGASQGPQQGPGIVVTSQSAVTTGANDGASITIPAGSAATGTQFTISPATSVEVPPSTSTIASVGPAYMISSNAGAFSGPITITLPYDPSKVSVGPSQILQNSLRIAVAQDNGNALGWNTTLAAQIVSTTADTVTADLPTFTNIGVYSVVQIVAPAAPSSRKD